MDLLLSLAAIVLAITWVLKPSKAALEVTQPGKGLRWLGVLSLLVLASAGLVFRLMGFSRSLWLDEFGTLWVVEGSLKQAWERALTFPQSSLHYLLTWASLRLLGQSEAVLRLPSLLCGVASVWVIHKLGREAGDASTGVVATTLAWFSYPMAEASANARPYSLVVLAAAAMLLGFLRAVRSGESSGRVLFVAGGAVLFYSHYICALFALGIAVAYLLIKELRKVYTFSQFAFDSSVQLLLAVPCLPQLRRLIARKGGLSWFEAPNYTVLFELGGSLLVLALAGVIGRRKSRIDRARARLLWITLATPVLVLGALAAQGTNVLDARYLSPVMIPAAVLAADGLLSLAPRQAIAPAAYWLLWTVFFFGAHYALDGSFNGAGRQDWRGVVERLDRIYGSTNRAPVLYRSGFVEDDARPQGGTSPAALAPLRSPGKTLPGWNIVPLTYRWDKVARRAEYFDQAVAPAIANAPVFFLVSCQNELDGYPKRLQGWVEQRFPGRFTSTRLDLGRGITVLQFQERRAALP